jgi:putative DNA primase/helicase
MEKNPGKGPPNASQHRGCAESAVAIPGLWLDIDCTDGEHKKKNLPSKAEAIEFLRGLPIQPTMVVDSGGGYHAYFLFKEPWILDSDSERKDANRILKGFEELAQRRAAERGWHLDSVAD